MAKRARTTSHATESDPAPSSPGSAPGLVGSRLGTVAGHPILAWHDGCALHAIDFTERDGPTAPAPAWLREPFVRYLAGEPESFRDVPVVIDGTPFQRRVWQALRAIPWGRVASYAEVAERIGVPRGMRAVGAANGANRLPIVIPCHRVVEGKGMIGGFSGGLDVKRALLAREGARFVGDRVHVGQLALFGADDRTT